jgi:DNA-binding beta-propeller fold protein YncE
MQTNMEALTDRQEQRMSRHRLLKRRPGAVFLVVLVVSVFMACSSAEANFEQVAQFGAGVMSQRVAGVAVNETSGDVYVADGGGSGGADRVERFDPEGNLIEAWGWGVSDGSAEFQRCTSSCLPGVAGEGAGQFIDPVGIAIDQQSGSVYVLDRERQNGVVQIFDEDGSLQPGAFGERGSADASQIGSFPEGFAVGRLQVMGIDGSGDIYVVENGATFGPRVLEFSDSGSGYEFTRSLGQGILAAPLSLAVDATGGVYVDEEERVLKFEPSGQKAWSTEGQGLEALTVDPASGESFAYSYVREKILQLDAGGAVINEFPASASLQEETWGLAFDPTGEREGRPAGILYATNQLAEAGFIFAQPPAVPPTIESESAANVGEVSSEIRAQIDPNGYATTYFFEYGSSGPCPSACMRIPAGDSSLGAGTGARAASAALSALQPGTTYHYRVLAQNVGGPSVGADDTFTTYPAGSPFLPDDRGYEMVSPVDKHGGEVYPPDYLAGSCRRCLPGENSVYMPMQPAPDGDQVAFEGQPFSPDGASEANEYLAGRGSGGWSTEGLSSPLQGGPISGFEAFSPDLSRGVIYQEPQPSLSPLAPAGYANLFLWASGEEPRPLVTARPTNRAPGDEFQIALAGANSGDAADGPATHIAFEANDALTGVAPDAPAAIDFGAAEKNLYEWSAGGLGLINVLPGDSTTAPGAVGSGHILAVRTGENANYSHAVSADGSRVFWTDTESGELFVREDGTRTVQIPDLGRCLGSIPVEERVCFLTASTDGSKVLLTDGHLYSLDGVAPLDTDLTGGAGGFEGILGASDDLSHVYFADSAALTPPTQINANGEAAETGADNVYSWQEGSVVFVARLLSVDNQEGIGGSKGAWHVSPSDRLAQVTADGRFLAFQSFGELTGQSNSVEGTPECGAGTSSCSNVFEYDSATGVLSCASCSPTGQRPVGPSALSLIASQTGGFPQPHNLAAGGRLFFNSQNVLSSDDTNGRIQDVYEWEPAGLGSCTRAGGCVSLISTGHSKNDSQFVNATPDGEDAFFVTRERLLPQDTDDLLDLYDARVGGGFATAGEPSPCSGEACKGSISAPPATSGTGSSSFSGPGNQKEGQRCRKGFVRKHGRCQKKHAKTKHAKHHKKKKAKSHGSPASKHRDATSSGVGR